MEVRIIFALIFKRWIFSILNLLWCVIVSAFISKIIGNKSFGVIIQDYSFFVRFSLLISFAYFTSLPVITTLTNCIQFKIQLKLYHQKRELFIHWKRLIYVLILFNYLRFIVDYIFPKLMLSGHKEIIYFF